MCAELSNESAELTVTLKALSKYVVKRKFSKPKSMIAARNIVQVSTGY